MQQNTMTKTEIESIFNSVCLAAVHDENWTDEAESLAQRLALVLGIDPAVLRRQERVGPAHQQVKLVNNELTYINDELLYVLIDEKFTTLCGGSLERSQP